MAGKVYFGNKSKQQWIKAPASGLKAGVAGYVNETQLLNGGAVLRRSSASHRKFSATWGGSMNSKVAEENLYTIKDYADGLYGDGPFYWLDPFAMNQNVLPPHWAAPMLAQNDWTDLSAGAIVPTFTLATVANNYPIKYAEYVTANNYQSDLKLTVIIPPDYSLNFGWHGPSGSSNSGIRIVPYLRSSGAADTALNPTRIDVGGSIRTNTKVRGDLYSYVEIFLATTTASTVKITGMIAQVLPENSTVATGGFISGRGTTSLQYATFPQIDAYSSAINDGWIGMAVDWVEVE
jgi:hypothetical protein